MHKELAFNGERVAKGGQVGRTEPIVCSADETCDVGPMGVVPSSMAGSDWLACHTGTSWHVPNGAVE